MFMKFRDMKPPHCPFLVGKLRIKKKTEGNALPVTEQCSSDWVIC